MLHGPCPVGALKDGKKTCRLPDCVSTVCSTFPGHWLLCHVPSSCGGKSKRCENTILHITDTLGLFPLLWFLTLLGHCCDCMGLVMGTIKNLYIKGCILLCVPECTDTNVYAGIVVIVFAKCRVSPLSLSGTLWLQNMLWCHISHCGMWWSLGCCRCSLL